MFEFIRKAKEFIKPFAINGFDSYDVNYELFIKHAYENPFIQAVFNEYLTDLKSINYIIVDTKGKEVKNEVADKIMRTLKRPSSELTKDEFIEAIATYLIFGGRCLMYKNKGIIKDDLILYSPDSFQIVRNERTLKIEEIRIGAYSILGNELENYNLIKNFNPADPIAGYGDGYSKIKPLALIGDMLNYIMKHNNNYLKNGGRPAGMLKIGNSFSKKEIEELKNKLNSSMTEAGNIIAVSEGIEFTPYQTTQRDFDWLNAMLEMQKIICRVL